MSGDYISNFSEFEAHINTIVISLECLRDDLSIGNMDEETDDILIKIQHDVDQLVALYYKTQVKEKYDVKRA